MCLEGGGVLSGGGCAKWRRVCLELGGCASCVQ